MKASDLYPDTSNTLKASDMIGQNRKIKVAGIDEITYSDAEGRGETKLVLKLAGTDKGLVLNKTNARTMIGLHGDETDAWIGVEMMLSTVPYNMNGTQVHGFMLQPVPTAEFDDDIPW